MFIILLNQNLIISLAKSVVKDLDKRLECVVADSEGNFHRTRKIDTFDPFIVDEELIVVTNHFINVLNKTLNEYNLPAGDCHS